MRMADVLVFGGISLGPFTLEKSSTRPLIEMHVLFCGLFRCTRQMQNYSPFGASEAEKELWGPKFRTLHEFACHPCAGAMLIFSVSIQFYYTCCRSEHDRGRRLPDICAPLWETGPAARIVGRGRGPFGRRQRRPR